MVYRKPSNPPPPPLPKPPPFQQPVGHFITQDVNSWKRILYMIILWHVKSVVKRERFPSPQSSNSFWIQWPNSLEAPWKTTCFHLLFFSSKIVWHRSFIKHSTPAWLIRNIPLRVVCKQALPELPGIPGGWGGRACSRATRSGGYCVWNPINETLTSCLIDYQKN